MSVSSTAKVAFPYNCSSDTLNPLGILWNVSSLELCVKPHQTKVPPFSPVLVAGMVLPGFARPAIARVARSFASGIWARHQRNFERLSDYQGARFLIDPIDLPLVFLLELAPEGPQVSIVEDDSNRDEKPPEVSATIRGPLHSLLELAEGQVDGDAQIGRVHV